MKELSLEKMSEVEGGTDVGTCAGAVSLALLGAAAALAGPIGWIAWGVFRRWGRLPWKRCL